MNWGNLVRISLTPSGGIEFDVGWVVIATVILAVLCLVVRYISLRPLRTFDIIEAEVRLGDIGSVKLRPSHEDVQLTYRAWVELSTRKAALPFDEENDVVVEVYDSWYELFGRMRELAKQMPAQRLRSDESSRKIVSLLVEALNRGLRPHLGRWQASFRHWYANELADRKELTPQEIQRQYPQYKELVADLKRVNHQILEYADVLKKISQG